MQINGFITLKTNRQTKENTNAIFLPMPRSELAWYVVN